MGFMGSPSDKNLITTVVAVAAVAGLAGGITSSLRQHGQLPKIPGQVTPPGFPVGVGSVGRRQAG